MGIKPDGGRVAARGLQYQYVSTLEHALDLLRRDSEAIIRIEGADGSGSIDDVDFDVIDSDSKRLLAAQIKTSTAAGGVSASSAFDVLAQLILRADANEYLLRYGAAPAPAARELAALLASGASGARLKAGLEALLANSPARLTQLRNLDPNDLKKLSRARIEFDLRDSHEILAALRERLRAERNASLSGLGEHSAGLLAGFLVSEVMRRAAQGPPELSGTELASLVLTPAEQLARVHGARDWGVVIGPTPLPPDVARPAVMAALTEVLDGSGARRVKQAVLCGLSGIGKSSMAAAYIAERADLYDWIVWVDSQTEASLRSGFEMAAAAICGLAPTETRELDGAQLRARVHTELGRAPGRWLLVFDDVRDVRVVGPWLAAGGNGDIIITCVDATVRLTTAAQLTVPAMEEDECEQLLAARLNVSDTDRQTLRPLLQRLADGLGRWPLALELGAGYMVTCDLDVTEVDSYLRTLKLRSLNDQDVVPIGYPRTLSAVVWTSVDALLDRANTSTAPGLAVGMLACAAYLTSRRIPAQLLAAAVIVDASLSTLPDGVNAGTIGVHPESFPILEAVRELRRFSLVSLDEPLPDSSDNANVPGENQTVSVNSVVQDLFRATATYARPNLVNNLAAHATRWQVSTFGLGEMDRAAVMFSHAAALATHAQALDIRTPEVALLLGNLAVTHLFIDNFAEAERLLLAEVDILSDPGCSHGAMLEQTYMAVAAAYFSNPEHSTIGVETVVDGLRCILAALDELSVEHPHAATTMVGSVLSYFTAYQFHGHSLTEEFADLEERFQIARSRLSATPWSQDHDRFVQAELLVNTGRPAEAEALLRQLLKQSEHLDGSILLRVRFRLIDALCQQERWAEARRGIAEVRELLHAELTPRSLLTHTAFNAALNAGPDWVVTGNVEAALLLDDLFNWPAINNAHEYLEPWRAHRLDVIRCLHRASTGDVARAVAEYEQLQLHEAAHFPVGDNPAPHEVAWQLVRARALKMLRRLMAAQPRPQLATTADPADIATTRPWTSSAYRRHRRAAIEFAILPIEAGEEALFIRAVTALAVYLESGIDRNPALDLVYSLSYALDGLGVKAQPWIAQLDTHDNQTGETSRLGTGTPTWTEDGIFTGHCVLVVPRQGRLIDPTIDQLPAVRELYKGPLVVHTELVYPDRFTTNFSDFGGRTFPMLRDTVQLRYRMADRSQNSLIGPENLHVRPRLNAYKRAGRELAAAVLRIQRIDDSRA